MIIAICFTGALVAATALTSAAMAGDAKTGKQLAERWCQSCHAIGANQAMAVTEAPPFATIASRALTKQGSRLFCSSRIQRCRRSD